MKFTAEQLLALAKAAGIRDAELAEDAAQADYNETQALEQVDASRGAIMRPRIEAELTDQITTTLAGKQGDFMVNRLAKLTGIVPGELRALPNDDERLKVALKHYEKTLGKSAEDAAEEIRRLTTEHGKAVDMMKGEYEQKLAAADERYLDHNTLAWLNRKSGKWALPPNADPALQATQRNNQLKLLQAALKEHFITRWDDKAEAPAFFQKDKPTLPALNAAGNQQFDVDEFAKTFYTNSGLWQENTSRQDPNHTMKDKGGDYRPAGGQQEQPGANPLKEQVDVVAAWANRGQ